MPRVTFTSFEEAYRRLGLIPLEAGHTVTPSSRMLHDLGVAGDDVDELLENLGVRELDRETSLRLGPYFPRETSRDAYLVAMARGRLSAFLGIRPSFYVARLRHPSISVDDFIGQL